VRPIITMIIMIIEFYSKPYCKRGGGGHWPGPGGTGSSRALLVLVGRLGLAAESNEPGPPAGSMPAGQPSLRLAAAAAPTFTDSDCHCESESY
jgi:hypothetical protein